MGAPPRSDLPTLLEKQAQTVWECQAMELTGEPEDAKRLTFARYWIETRRAPRLNTRILPAPDGPRAAD